VVIAGPGVVPKTSSGKIRRGAARDAYLTGELGRRRSAARQWARLAGEALGARLARLSRQAARLGFAAYVGVLLLLTVPPLWVLVRLAPGAGAAARLVRLWCRVVLALGGCPLRVEGSQHLAGAAAAILAANHASYLDAVALLAALPVGVRFVATRELGARPAVGTVIRKVGHLPVERADPARSVADAERVSAALQGDGFIQVFPEGTVRRAPGLLPFRLGAFKSAVEGGRPVIPVALRGTRQVLPADTWLPWPGPITVTIGAPIPPEGSGWPAMVGLRDRVRAAIARGTGEPPVEQPLGPA
jgi:1-acyl-sn-glycerol-3-phosphate acyltransferase